MTFTLHAPQITYLILLTLDTILAIVKHGESRGKFNGPLYFLDACITIAILYWGGFFGGAK